MPSFWASAKPSRRGISAIADSPSCIHPNAPQPAGKRVVTNNQALSLTDQLRMGVRFVELDVHWVKVGAAHT